MEKIKHNNRPQDEIEEIPEYLKKKVNSIATRILTIFNKRFENFLEKRNQKLEKSFKKSIKELENFCKRIDSLEEAFYLIYTNIKRNQFLYSKYPEDWWNECYDNIQENLKKENGNGGKEEILDSGSDKKTWCLKRVPKSKKRKKNSRKKTKCSSKKER